MLIIIVKTAIFKKYRKICFYFCRWFFSFSFFLFFYKSGFQNRISSLKVTELFKQEHKVKLSDSCYYVRLRTVALPISFCPISSITRLSLLQTTRRHLSHYGTHVYQCISTSTHYVRDITFQITLIKLRICINIRSLLITDRSGNFVRLNCLSRSMLYNDYSIIRNLKCKSLDDDDRDQRSVQRYNCIFNDRSDYPKSRSRTFCWETGADRVAKRQLIRSIRCLVQFSLVAWRLVSSLPRCLASILKEKRATEKQRVLPSVN